MKSFKIQVKKGFTLMETVVALGIAAVALSFFLAAFAPATLGIKKASRVQEAKNLVTALEAEMGVVRFTENALYTDPFDKAFQWIGRTGTAANGLIMAFQYRASSTAATDIDGLYPAFTGDYINNAAAQPMILQNRVCPINSVSAGADALRYAQVEGGAYVMDLIQLTTPPGGGPLNLSGIQGVVNADGITVAATSPQYDQGVILYQVDVYYLRSTDPAYLTGSVNVGHVGPLSDTLGNPIYSTQLGVFR